MRAAVDEAAPLAYPPCMSTTVQLNPRPGLVQRAVGSQIVTFFSPASVDVTGSYASIADLELISIPDNSAGDFSFEAKQRWLRIASNFFDAFIGQRFATPLALWGDFVIYCVCEMAYAGLINKRGYNPDGKTEKTLLERKNDVRELVESARDYTITPDQRLATTEPMHVGEMFSDTPLGWSESTRARALGRWPWIGLSGSWRGL